ncbi:MAG: carbohydrate ABC transporter substrate-binding protein [Oscillospiraceae bacterium]|nr:carbohydrate ABC transporter substrate-binding protein [Oscillospiraceae bacterium]
MKKIIAMLLALIMALGLVACGNGGGGADADAKTVVYWSMWESTEPQGQAIAAAVESFTKETGIKVDLQFKGRTGIREGLQPALDAGQVIDVFDEDIDRVNTTFAPYLLDLEELAAKYDYEKTAIAGLIGACREVGGGKLMSVPYQPNVFNFFYNAKIFEEVGVSAPTTWAELLDVCAKIKAAGYTPITCDDAYITCMIGYHLGRLVGEEGVRDIVMNGKWDDPAVAQFAKEYEELASLGYFSSNVESNVWPNGQNVELAGGTAAMYLNGSWLPNEVKGITGEDFVWGCFSYPTLENGTVGLEAANYGAQVYAINNKTEVADEAFQLIKYLTKGEADKNLSTLSVGIPADTTNTEWPALMAGVKPVMEATTLRWSWAVGVEANNDITPAIKENTLKLCGGSITADEFVANMMAAAGK